ncbi:MAG: hypothetical protein ABIO57_00020 [Candidatus Paceibacterota bacterium]
MEILGKLLGGIQRVKIMRLFLLNPEQGYEADQIAERSRMQVPMARRVTNQLAAMTLVKKKSFVKEVVHGRTGKVSKKRVQGWFLDPEFPYILELKQLLIEGDFFKHADLVKRFRPAGRIQFLVVSGIFIQNSESRLDLLLVGDHLKRSHIQKAVSVLESELGKELVYAVFDVADFNYRVSMYDKLLRDVFDFPHERLIALKDFSTFTMPN